MEMRIALMCLFLFACADEQIIRPEYVTVDPPEELTVSIAVDDTWTEHVGGGLWQLYSMGTIGNPNDVDVMLALTAEVWRGDDSVMASTGVIGYGRPLDMFAGLIDTVDFIPAHGEVDYWIATRQFSDGLNATARLVLEVREK